MLAVKLPQTLSKVLAELKLLAKTELKIIIITIINKTITAITTIMLALPIWRSAALKLLKKKVNYGTGFLSKLTKYLRENKTQERPPANTRLGRHMTECESSLLGAGPNP